MGTKASANIQNHFNTAFSIYWKYVHKKLNVFHRLHSFIHLFILSVCLVCLSFFPLHCCTSSVTSLSSEVEEINTKELAQRISAELKRYSIPQAIFAQRVLCRSQGTLSDLLRNPKPWSKLKSGRETFRRMFKWLQEPEFQRMSALRMAGKKHLKGMNQWKKSIHNLNKKRMQFNS